MWHISTSRLLLVIKVSRGPLDTYIKLVIESSVNVTASHESLDQLHYTLELQFGDNSVPILLPSIKLSVT